MAFGGAFLRIAQTLLRVLQLLCGLVALGVYSYFLDILSKNNIPIPTWARAVEGMSGASVLYLIFAVLFTVCLGGISFFAFVAVVLDICFAGCYAAIAYYNRNGDNSCSGTVITIIGSGSSKSSVAGHNLHNFCRLETAVFAVALINIFLFLITAFLQVLLARHHRREKRYGPSPANNYTSGRGRRPLWGHSRTRNTRDAEMATAAGALRPSQETGFTSTTEGNAFPASEPKFGRPEYGQGNYYSNRGVGANY